MQSTYMKEPEPYRIIRVENINFYAHFHQQVEIVYCIAGEMKMLIDGLSYTLQAKDAAVIFPNQHHYYRPPEPGSSAISYLLIFEPFHTEGFYTEWIHKLPATPVLHGGQLPEFFPALWDQFYQVYAKQPELYMFKAYASLLTAHMLPLLELHSNHVSSISNPDAMQAILNYVNQHFTEKLSLGRIAKELGFSPTALSRMFSQRLGCNFMTHVNSLRVAYAKKLLRSSHYSINEILRLSGFQSKRTFFRNFQNMCGQSPGEYRKNNISIKGCQGDCREG